MLKILQALPDKIWDDFRVVLTMVVLTVACAPEGTLTMENLNLLQPLHKRVFLNTRGRLWGESAEARFLREQAEKGDAKAQCRLGILYANGKGVRRNLEKARTWVTRAAEQGFAPAQCILGGSYRTGQGAPRNDAEAAKWYRLAAEQGVGVAQYNLGQFYYKGEGVPRDCAEAAKWFRRAAERGIAPAQFNIGAMYDSGEGVPENTQEAYIWYFLAAEGGDRQAAEHLDDAAKRMSPVDLSDAQASIARRHAEILGRMDN